MLVGGDFLSTLLGDSRAPTSLRSPTSNTPQSATGILCNPFPFPLSQASLDEVGEWDFFVIPTVCRRHPVQRFFFRHA